MLDLVFYIIIAFISFIALGQGQNYIRAKTVKKYFKSNKLDYILVCGDSKTSDYWNENIDREKYNKIEVINIHDRETSDRFLNAKLLETTARKVGVMRYPCLLTIEDNELKGKAFE